LRSAARRLDPHVEVVRVVDRLAPDRGPTRLHGGNGSRDRGDVLGRWR